MKDYNLKDLTNIPLKVQLIIGTLLCVVVFYFAYLWDISGLKRQLKVAALQEQDLKIQLEALTNNLALINNDIAELPKLRKLLTEWQKKLITSSELPDLLNEILKIGTANQLQFELFNPDQAIKEELYYRVPIKAVITGEYHQVANFISQVSNLPWIVVIDNFTMIRGLTKLFDKKEAQKPGYANRLTTTLILQVYYFAEADTHEK